MEGDNILDIIEVMDESQNVRRRFLPSDGSDFVPQGRYVVLRENGRLLLEITYRKGIVHGPYVCFWPNRKVSCEGQFHEGEQDGCWHFYNENGTIHAIIQARKIG